MCATLHEINLHVWSLCVPIYVKRWPKVKLGQVEIGSNIAQNRLFSRLEVICGHYDMWQLMWKGDKKWKWKCVKLVGSNNAYKRFKIH